MTNKRSILSLLLSLVMMLTFIPAMAFADSDDSETGVDFLTVCGIDMLGSDGGASSGNGKIQGASFDISTNTLTLNNATLSGSYEGTAETESIIRYSGSKTLNVKLIGNNTMTGSVDNGIVVYGTAGISISGTGSLETAGCSCLVYQEPCEDESSDQGDIIINGVTLISDKGAVSSKCSNLTIIDSQIKANKCDENPWYAGVETGFSGAKGKLTVQNSTIELLGGYSVSWITADWNGEYIYAGEKDAEYRVDPSTANKDEDGNNYVYDFYILITPQDKDLPYKMDFDKQYTLNFDANNGKADYASKTVIIGESYGDLPKATRTGYAFTGWYTQKSGGTLVTSETIYNSTEDTTVYAQWKANKYNIVFNKNGGKGSMAKMNGRDYGKKYKLSANKFKKYGYTFKGWSTSKKGKVKYKNKQSIQNLTATNNKTITLYAIWGLSTRTPVNLSAGRWYALTYPSHASAAGVEKRIQKYATDWNLPGNRDKGKKVYAMADGVVEYVNKASGSVRIRYTEKLTLTNGYTFKSGHWRSWYGHMKNISVKKGQKIKKGKAVGTIGNKGGVPYHLHLAIFGDSEKKVLKKYDDIITSKPISPYWIAGLDAKKWYCDNESGTRGKIYDKFFEKKNMPK